MKLIFKVLTGFVLVSLLFAPGSGLWGCAPAAPSSIRIGYLLGDLHHLPFFVAQDKGFFTDEGLDIEVVGPFEAGPAEMDALAAGQIDMGYVGMAPAVMAAARKIPLSIVSGVNLEGSGLVTHTDISSVPQLKSKKIATPAPGSIQYVMFGMLLSANNLSFNDIELFPGTVKPPDMPQSLQTGRIDGYFVWEPFVAKSVVGGYGKVLVESKDIWPGHPCCVIVAGGDFVRSRDGAVASVIRAHLRAIDYIEANPAEAKAIAGKWTRLDPDVIDNAFQRVKYTSALSGEDVKRFVKEIIDLGETGSIKPIITVDEVPDADKFVATIVDTKFLQR
ncbi:MAG: ABC transporter substrate-binding protein [Dehalococcoidia bacterium]|nr:ABC transporter substrate-binding protein [Dehalococcoidia bacterium]